ncbi:MAG: hypothetical protein R2725_14665 [Solirubrobacterales bacterium]
MAARPSSNKTSTAGAGGLRDRITGTTTKIGTLYIDGYEKSVDVVVGLHRRVAAEAPIDSVQTVLGAQADLIAGVGEATASASRKIVA